MSHATDWRGVPLSKIYGAESPWSAPEFPPVQPSFNHAVLYHVSSDGSLADDRPPKPQIGQDKWDQYHVRMPCSQRSLYPIVNNKGETKLKKRWAIIESSLSKPIANTQQLAAAILTYNTKFKDRWKFVALHKLFNEYLEEEECQYFFDVTLPQIIRLALDLPKLVQAPIPLLKQHKNMSVSLSQQQIASLLANAFLCTFPRRNSLKRDSEFASYPFINFNVLYETAGGDEVMEKLKCICHYFRRVCVKVPGGAVTFWRRSVPPARCPAWASSARPVAALPVHVQPFGAIEDASGLIQLDFANKYLGGGVLGHGCVQEEIRFVICPELMVCMLFTEELRPNEALIMIGCERYSEYGGYGRAFWWAGEHRDATPRDRCGRRRCAVLAVDAAPVGGVGGVGGAGGGDELARRTVTRDLNKAWVGFSFFAQEDGEGGLRYPGVATGNWGCGAFGGSPRLKSLLQLLACAEARRPMAYYTFGDVALRDDIHSVYTLLARRSATVGQVYALLMQFCDAGLPAARLHAFLRRALAPPATPAPTSTDTLSQTAESLPDYVGHTSFDSPDLFSQDVTMEDECGSQISSHSDTIVKGNCEENEPCAQVGETEAIDNRMTSSDNKMTSNDNKMAASVSKMGINQTSRLFDEIEKLDEGNGRLDLNKKPTTRLAFGCDTSVGRNSTNSSEKIENDVSVEVKKRISKKITDYFAKKAT